jgi:hypothetical protein
MNDAHDNSAGDREMLCSIQTDLAVDAFREVERKKYQLELKEHVLAKALNEDINVSRYYTEAEEIRIKFEQDRAAAAHRGALPRERS